MNKVISINLAGNAYQLEDGGYEALRSYLDDADRRLEGNPDRGEILADIERAIAEKCRAALSPHKSVVTEKEIATILAEMGPVDKGEPDDAGEAASSAEAPPRAETPGPARRLYRIPEGRMISGVCNGIAAYFDCDPTLVRLAYALLAVLTFGVALLAYIIMTIVIPKATTPAEKAAASGGAWTSQDFIRRAKEGYYEGMRSFGDRRAHREWKRRFKRDMRDWSRNFRQEFRQRPSPVASILATLLLLVWIAAAAALFLGIVPHPGVPLWFALVAITLVYGIVSWPFKSSHRDGPSLVLLILLVALLCYGNRHYSGFHHDLRGVGAAIRNAFDSLRH